VKLQRSAESHALFPQAGEPFGARLSCRRAGANRVGKTCSNPYRLLFRR
jgi:hypothetical protein